MKKNILSFISLVLLAATSIGQTLTKNFIDQPYIEVLGSTDSLVTPNQIFIKIVIAEKDSKDRIPVEQSESKMIEAFKALGINTEQDLTTSDMLSNYKYYFLKQKDILKSKEYILKVTNAATASKVFIKLEDLGISNASINRLDHTDLENIKNGCRTKAIENAKAKAIALTKPIGQSIGNAIFISDNELAFENRFQKEDENIVKSYYLSDQSKYDPPKIDFAKIRVRTVVSVRFILK